LLLIGGLLLDGLLLGGLLLVELVREEVRGIHRSAAGMFSRGSSSATGKIEGEKGRVGIDVAGSVELLTGISPIRFSRGGELLCLSSWCLEGGGASAIT
jgi:hypothetical protein